MLRRQRWTANHGFGGSQDIVSLAHTGSIHETQVYVLFALELHSSSSVVQLRPNLNHASPEIELYRRNTKGSWA
jgi:hypothetical protein